MNSKYDPKIIDVWTIRLASDEMYVYQDIQDINHIDNLVAIATDIAYQ